MPDFDRLKSKLTPKKGTYTCHEQVFIPKAVKILHCKPRYVVTNLSFLYILSTYLHIFISGLRAYACQCKWKSVDDLETVDAGFKWVCGKH